MSSTTYPEGSDMARFGYLHNDYALASSLRWEFPLITTSGGSRFHYTVARSATDRVGVNSWADAVAAAGVATEWVVTKHQGWLPAGVIAASKEARLRWRKRDADEPGAFVKFSGPGVPCEHYSSGAWTISYCGRLAVDTVSYMSNNECPTCAMHLAGHRRSEANMAAHRARWDEQSARRNREQEIGQASADWVERLFAEFGFSSHPMRHHERLGVEVNPEMLYEVLVSAGAELREMGVDLRALIAEHTHGPAEHNEED